MNDAPERMFVRCKPNGALGRWHDATSLPETAAIASDGDNPMCRYILDTPEALAKSPHAQALVKAAVEAADIDAALDAMEAYMRADGLATRAWRTEMSPDQQDKLRACVRAGIAAAIREVKP